jgi:hypothetical protein
MNKAERQDQERVFDQKEREIAATLRLAAAFERVADAQEIATGYRMKPTEILPLPVAQDPTGA